MSIAAQFSAGGQIIAGATSLISWAGHGSMNMITTGTLLVQDNVGDSTQTIQLGANTATPGTGTFQAASGSGTDKGSSTAILSDGLSTGTGSGGGVRIRTSRTGSASASTSNTLMDRARYVAKYVTLTNATASPIFTVTLPATNSVGVAFTCTVYAGDGTDFQSLSTDVSVDAVAKTTTITPVVRPTGAQTDLAGSSGTLSVTYTVVDSGSNLLTVKCNANSSLTPTYLRAEIVMKAINPHGTGVVINEL